MVARKFLNRSVVNKAYFKYYGSIILGFALILSSNYFGSLNSVAEGDIESSNIDDYSGIYYLHSELPQHGQNIGNTHDVGDLQKEQPHGNEERYCAKWVQYDFDDHIFGELTGDESYEINSVYFHIWWKSANEKADIGVEVHGRYDSSIDYSFTATHDEAKTTQEANGYWLTTYLLDVGYSGNDPHEVSIKVTSIDAIPSVFSSEKQYSFVIINPVKNASLKMLDSDDDGLDDHSELFDHHTNPYDIDTDNDGLDDNWEVRENPDLRTDPNDFDVDNDDIMDGKDALPNLSQYRTIGREWVVSDREIISGDGIILRNNIVVEKGGHLTIRDSVLKMNQFGEHYRILVKEGGMLEIEGSKLITDDPDHWYSMTLKSDHWHGEKTIEILGEAKLRNNIINYGSMIYVKNSNDTIITNNQINHFYYGIFCSYSSPEISDNEILPFIGNGIFLWYSSPEISRNKITTYIGTGISCYHSSPIVIDCTISGGSNDFFLSGGSKPIVSNTVFNSSMVHVDDGISVLLVGEFQGSSHETDNENQPLESNNFSVILILAACLALILLVIVFLVKVGRKERSSTPLYSGSFCKKSSYIKDEKEASREDRIRKDRNKKRQNRTRRPRRRR